jgi:hypothetical protein
VFPVRYEQEFYISEDAILHSQSRENFKSYSVNSWHLDMCDYDELSVLLSV